MKYAYRVSAIHNESKAHVYAHYQTKPLALTAVQRMPFGYWRVLNMKRVRVTIDRWTHQCRRTNEPPTLSDDGNWEDADT
jgi:hypothetical protein